MVNALPVKVEFVAVTGDLFSDSITRNDVVTGGVAALRELKVPVYCVPGNHDVAKSDVVRTSALFAKHFGPFNRIVNVGDVTCLFLSSEIAEDEPRQQGDVERERIGRLLPKGRGEVLIFMHRPPLYDLLNGSDGERSWDDAYDRRWESCFEAHPEIRAVFCGHFHRDVMGWIGHVPVYVAPALARFWDRQPSFRLYRYGGGRFDYWTLYPERTRSP